MEKSSLKTIEQDTHGTLMTKVSFEIGDYRKLYLKSLPKPAIAKNTSLDIK